MKIITYIFAVCVLFSCENSTGVKEQPSSVPEHAELKENDPVPGKEPQTSGLKTELRILLPATYREWEGKYPVDHLTKDWVELYRKNGRYYLEKADYKIEKGSDECSGSDTKTIITKRNAVLLMNLPDPELGEIGAVKMRMSKIWPNEKTSFQFNGTTYYLRAEGEILSGEETMDSGEDRFHDVKNYKLYISTGTTAETLGTN